MTAKLAIPSNAAHHLALEEQRWLTALRAHRKAHRQKAARRDEHLVETLPPPPTLGQRLADAVARTMGSWTFIAIQSVAIVIWITFNTVRGTHAWDAYPFILLNLLLSFQAAYTAPVIMMSQNRQAAKDRIAARHDYEVNLRAQLEIIHLHRKLDRIATLMARKSGVSD